MGSLLRAFVTPNVTPDYAVAGKKTHSHKKFEGENKIGISNGSRTHVAGMRTRCPRPLDDGDASLVMSFNIAGFRRMSTPFAEKFRFLRGVAPFPAGIGCIRTLPAVH